MSASAWDGSTSLLEYTSAHDFVEFDRISNVKMKSVVDFRTECKILKEPNLEMPISSDDNSTIDDDGEAVVRYR